MFDYHAKGLRFFKSAKEAAEHRKEIRARLNSGLKPKPLRPGLSLVLYKPIRKIWRRKPATTVFYVPPGGYGIVMGALPPINQAESYPKLAELLAQVCGAHKLSAVALKAASRNAKLVRARHEFMYLAALHTLCSYPQIGRQLGGRDHTTVIHGINSYCERNKLPHPRTGEQCMTKLRKRREDYARALRELHGTSIEA